MFYPMNDTIKAIDASIEYFIPESNIDLELRRLTIIVLRDPVCNVTDTSAVAILEQLREDLDE